MTNVKEKRSFKVWLKDLYSKEGTKTVLSSLACIFLGILVGLILLVVVALLNNEINANNIWRAFVIIFTGVFYNGTSIRISIGIEALSMGNMLIRTTPLIMTGLSVAIAFKTGLFNIGAAGQYLMGTMTSLFIALSIPSSQVPPLLIWFIALLGGMAAGMLWGAIPGLFKALLGVNEVIICIMTNWIAANVVSWAFSVSNLRNTPAGKTGYIYPTGSNGVRTPRLLLDKILPGSWADGGIIIAILIAIAMFIMLNKTTFGYELRACGSNRNASKYAGMNDKRNIVLSMAIAGGLAALGGSLYYLNGQTEFYWNTYMSLPGDGFNGIPVALLANNNPIGTIFTALLLAYLKVGGSKLASFTKFNEFISDLMVAVIIYFAGFSRFIKGLLTTKKEQELIHSRIDPKKQKRENEKVKEA